MTRNKFMFIIGLSLTSLPLFAESNPKAIKIAGVDHFRPFATYFEIQKTMGQYVARGRVATFTKHMTSIEGTQDFCIEFDPSATIAEYTALKNDLLAIKGVKQYSGAEIGLLSLAESCL